MNVIEQIATALNASYIRDDFARINLLADKVTKYPLIAETLPTDGVINGAFAPAYAATKNVIVCFLVPCHLDFTGDDVSAKIDEMINLAQRFCAKYKEVNGDFPANIRFNAVLDFLDANLCGIRCTIPKYNDPVCI